MSTHKSYFKKITPLFVSVIPIRQRIPSLKFFMGVIHLDSFVIPQELVQIPVSMKMGW